MNRHLPPVVFRLVVIVCHREDDPVPPGIRECALRERHPEAQIMVVEDYYDPEDSRLWADLTRQWLGCAFHWQK